MVCHALLCFIEEFLCTASKAVTISLGSQILLKRHKLFVGNQSFDGSPTQQDYFRLPWCVWRLNVSMS